MNKDEKKVSRRLPTQTTETVASVVEVPECAEPTTHVHGTKVATFVTDVETGIRRRTYKDWKGSFAQWLNGGGPKPALVRTSAYIYRVLADNPTRRIGAIGDHFDEMAKSGLDVSSIGFDLYHSPFKNIGLADLTEHFNLWENIDHLLFNEQEKKVMDALLILFFEQDRVFTTPIAVSIREWLPLTVKLVGENLACGSAYRDHVYDYVMLCAGIYAFSVVSHNYDIASTLYKKYLSHKVRFITRVALEADDIPVEAAVEEAVEPDNSREVGVVLDTPTSGTMKITGIGTPELACEVIPDEAEVVIAQDTVYEDTARALRDGMSVALPRSNVTVQIHKHDPEDPVPGTLVEVSTGEVVGEQNPIVKVKELESIPLCTEGRMEEGADPAQLTDVVEEPVPYPLRLDSLSQELKRVSLAFLAMPQEAREAALREILANTPERTFTVLGGVNVEADDLVKGGDVPELVGDARSTVSNSLLERYGSDHDLSKHYGPEALPILKATDTKAMHESIMKKVTRKKRGWLTGKFCMLHMGHINFIHQAATLCDELVVVLSHSDHRFKDSRLSYRNKMLWLRTTFKNEPHITVVGIDETDVPEYPNGWQAWSDLVKAKIGTDFDYIFTSEPGDQSGYNTHFPGQEVRVVDAERKGVDISATRIRGDMVKHWGMMPTVVRKDFVMRICIVGTESCVDGDTEYHNGERWVKIRDWKPGDRVLQYQSDGAAKFVLPERYIKLPATEMWEMSNTYGTWSQVYTDDHDLVYVTSRGNLAKIPFGEVRKRHFESPYGFQGRFLASFDYRKGNIDIDENWLRLAIAVSADGTKAKHGWVLKIKKERKKTRLRELIQAAGLELHEGKLEGDGFTRFTVPLEYGVKEFPAEWIHLNSHLRDVFVDEIFRWDGHQKDGEASSYFSTIEKNAEITQFLLAASGIKARLFLDEREGRTTCYKVSAQTGKYLSLSINKLTAHQRDKMIKPFTPTDGYKYCFTVESGMLVLRRKGQIFITGNCGKTSLTKMLAKRHQTSWVEEYGRTYCEQDLCMDEDLLCYEDYGTIAARRYDMEQEAAMSANRVLFVDTAAMSTNYFCLLYEGREHPMVSAYQEREHYDAYIYLTDDVAFVEDGLRKNRNRDNTRFLFEKMLYANAKRHGSEIFKVSGNYNERLNKAIAIVDELLARPLTLV